jgi:hypothetical protein
MESGLEAGKQVRLKADLRLHEPYVRGAAPSSC